MGKHYSRFIPLMDTVDFYVKLGFCPDVVRLYSTYAGLEMIWCRCAANDSSISQVANGDRTLNTGSGIKLVKFPVMDSNDATAVPTVVEAGQWNDADGIMITDDAVPLADDVMFLLEAWTVDVPLVRAVHDGTNSSNTYFEDASVDFRDAGVSSGWVIYNQSNGNYCYVGEIQRPAGKAKFCRLTSVFADGTPTTAADFDTSDVCFIMPKSAMPYPLSAIGLMT